MKSSESAAYLMYGRAFAYGNYRKSLDYLLDFVSENQKEFELCERADMIQRIGDAYYHLGDIGLALFFYQLGMDCDRGSLLPKLQFAKFVGRRLKNIDHAIQICNEIISLAEANHQNASEEELGSEWYIRNANELIDELKREHYGKSGDISNP
jgi:tetratricopeptide (TPR) repeat protein